MILKWIEVGDEVFDVYYSLKDNYNVEIAYMYFYDNCWSLIPTLSILQDTLGKKFYRDYTEKDKAKAQFHAILDIQSELNKIGYLCFDYSNAISNYTTRYLEGINNEN